MYSTGGEYFKLFTFTIYQQGFHLRVLCQKLLSLLESYYHQVGCIGVIQDGAQYALVYTIG